MIDIQNEDNDENSITGDH